MAAIAVAALVLASCGGSDGDDTQDSDSKSTFPRARFTTDVETGTLDSAALATTPPAGEADAPAGGGTDAVITGTPIDIGQSPWTAALVLASARNAAEGQFCGGVLAQAQWVMTAAHCVTQLDDQGRLRFLLPTGINVVLGRADLASSGGERLQVSRVFVARAYDPDTLENDYAWLELATPSSQIPVKLPTAGDAALWQPGINARVTGWGCTQQTIVKDAKLTCPSSVPLLQQATTTFQSADVCIADAAKISGAIFSTTSMLCTLSPAGTTQRSCNGDSGGPLTVLATDGRWYLTGLVSWGQGGCPAGLSTYYAFALAGLQTPSDGWYKVTATS